MNTKGKVEDGRLWEKGNVGVVDHTEVFINKLFNYMTDGLSLVFQVS